MRFICPTCKAVVTGEPGAAVECQQCKKSITLPTEKFAPGTVIGDFEILREIARGGVGIVFLARQISLDRQVALKILQEKLKDDPDFVKNFNHEALNAAKINHPNIVQVYAAGTIDGACFFAMEFIEGETMKHVLAKAKVIEPRQAARIIRSVADALDCAWTEQKMVHQDIKPDNIMLTKRGQAKLADLGLAKTAAFSNTPGEDEEEVIGTPQYISPEQLYGQETDVRSDIYSLGATFYHLITGRIPYTGKNGDEIARQHVEGTLTPPIEVVPAIGPELNRIVCKMMEKDKNNRYQSAADLVADLKQYLNSANAPAVAAAQPQLQAQPQKITLAQSSAERTPKFGDSRGVESFEASRTTGAKLGESRMEGSKLTPSASAIAPAAPKEQQPSRPAAQPQRAALSIKEEKPAQEDEGLKGPPILQKLDQDQKKKADFKIPPLAWKIPLAVVVILAAAGAVFISLVKTQTLPASAHGFEDKVLAMFGKAYDRQQGMFISLSETRNTQTPGTVPAGGGVTRTAPPLRQMAPAAPKTRPDYIRAANKLARAFKLEPQNEAQNLAAADEFFATYPEAVTAEEKKAAAAINRIMAPADEAARVAPFREAARKQTLAQEEALRTAAAQQEQAARDKLNELAEKTTEAAQKTSDVAEQAVQADEAIRNSLEWRVAPYLKKIENDKDQLVAAFVQSLTAAKDTAWKQQNRKAEQAEGDLPYDAQKEELAAARSYAGLAKTLNDVYPTARAIGEFLVAPENMKSLLIQKPGSSSLFCCDRIEGATLYGKDLDGKELTLDLNDLQLRQLFTKRLDRKFKTTGSSFIVALAGGEIAALSADWMTYPSDAVRDAAREIAERYLRASFNKADDAGKMKLRERYGSLDIFPAE